MNTDGPFHSERPVCVLGTGLIGGSVLQALAAAGRIAWGWNRSPVIDPAVTSDLPGALRRAHADDAVIVIAVPEPAVSGLLDEVVTYAPTCPLTDAVSVKGSVRDTVAARGLTGNFCGGHPMAGTSESGWAAATPGLFRGAIWVLATDDDAPLAPWHEAASIALDCGAHVVPAGTAAHDDAAARISHSVHLLAEAAAATAVSDPEIAGLALSLAAGSFRDVTRVAHTQPALVRAMVEANRDATLDALDETIALLGQARAELAERGTVVALVDRGFAARSRYDNVLRHPFPADLLSQFGKTGWESAFRTAAADGAVISH